MRTPLLAALACLLALPGCGASPAPAAEKPPEPWALLYVAPVDGGDGYIDRDGNVVIRGPFSLAERFSEGLARVYTPGGEKAGFIDPAGEWVIEPRFRSAKSFSDGRAAAKDPQTRLWGYIDRTGAWAIPPQFARAMPFREGRATVELAGPGDRGASIDVDGRVVFPFPPGGDVRDPPEFSEGLMPIEIKGATRTVRYVDRDGETAFEGPWRFGRGFSEGLAPVRGEETWSFVDRTGEVVFGGFDFAWGFCEGWASVKPKGSEQMVYIDRTGAVVLSPGFERAACFREGLADMEKDGKVGYIDKTGAWVIPPTWDDPQSSASRFRHGRAMVGRRDAEGRLERGFVDRTGKVIYAPRR